MLLALKELFESMEKENVRYVVWKSLENLEEALDGVGDVDILFASVEDKFVRSFMANHGFVEDLASAACTGENITVFRGFDKNSCKFIMLHAHFELRFGSKKFKEFRFPYESDMLENFKRRHEVKILKDAYFMITRILHATVKRNYDDNYIQKLAEDFNKLSAGESAIVIKHLGFYFNTDIPNLMASLEEGNIQTLSDYYLLAYEKLDIQIPILEYKKNIIQASPRLNFCLRSLNRIFRVRRNKVGNGLELSLSGYDGTGKTTVSFFLEDKLSSVAPVKRIYLGRNRWFFLNMLINRLQGIRAFFWLQWLWPVTSTLEILGRVLKGKLLKAFGCIVIYDRAIGDLKLKYHAKRKSVAWFPMLVYSSMRNFEVDLHYLLIAEPSIVLERKGYHNINEIEELRRQYLKSANDNTRVMDTSELSIRDVASNIIQDIFYLSCRRANL